jgi:hypothetical protein
MRCKTCNYALWNLRSRTCPECGSPFAPSDFDFVPGSVRFCCPHCNQNYYGTSPAGHLTPRTFNCVSCQAPVDMDEMVLLPTEGLREEQTRRASNPWLTREASLPQRWLRTVGWAMIRPGGLIEGTPLASSRGPAWNFALATYLVIAVGFMAWWVALMGIGFAVGGGGVGGGAPLAFMLFGLAIMMAGAIVVFMVTVLLWAATAHLALLLTGRGTKGFGRTMQAMLYSSGANALSFIPCLNYVLWIWWVVSFAIMLCRGHGVSAGRAALAAVAGPVVGIGLLTVFYAGLFAAMGAGGAGTWAGGAPITAHASTDAAGPITSKLVARQRGEGAWPDHGARLLDEQLSAVSFVGPHSPTSARDVTAGGVPVADLAEMPWQERREAIDAIAAALPADTVAHRVGDFVFTYHGLGQNPDQRLWVVIESPPPSEVWTPAEVIVGLVGGWTRSFPAAGFPRLLDQQNELRAEHGLAPLWHPDTVSDAHPQTADDR